MKAITNTLACPALALFSVMAGAENLPARELMLDIEAQPIVDALNGWAQQTGMQIIVPDIAGGDGIDAPSVRGQFTPEAALIRLLAGSALVYEFVNERTVIVQEPRARRSKTSNAGVSARFMRVATQSERGTNAPTASDAPGSEQEKSAKVEEVIVTAQKRRENLQNVPISISVLGGTQLDQSTAQSVNEVLSGVPGVSVVGASQAGGTVVTVRGVAPASTFFGGSGTVSYYLDSVPFSLVNSAIAPDANAYDMERIEVLRGPQGTLYGASALNGVVRVLTHDANLSEFDLKARASGSGTQSGDENYRGDLAVNVPIVDGKLAARAVVGYQNLSGWVDTPIKENANDGELFNARLKVDARPSDDLSIGFSSWIARQDFGAPPGVANSQGRSRSLIEEPLAIDYNVHGLSMTYDFPGFAVTNTASYLEYETRDTIDFVGVLGFSYPLIDRFDIKVFSEELNLTSASDGPWRWTAGAFYRRGENRTWQMLPAIVTLDWTDSSTSYAIFGELTRRLLNERLELTVGARYFHDEVTTKENPASTGALPDYRAEASFEATTPRAVLTWFPSELLTIYGSYSEGFRSGSPQAFYVTGGVPGFPAVEPDQLHNYEIGMKWELFGKRLSVESALYYIDWEDVQHYITVPFGTTRVAAVVNGQGASGLGFDLGLMARPVDGVELGLSFNRNDLTVDGDVISDGVVLFASGDRLNYSPEYTTGASAAYLFPIGGTGLEGRLSGSFTHMAKQTTRAVAGGVALVADGDRMTLGSVSFSIRSVDHWEMTIFADNVTNEEGEYYHSAADTSPDPEGIRVRPRTVGLQLDYKW